MLQLLCPLQVQLVSLAHNSISVSVFVPCVFHSPSGEQVTALGQTASPQMQELIGTINEDQDPDFWPCLASTAVSGCHSTAGKGNCSVGQREPEPQRGEG